MQIVNLKTTDNINIVGSFFKVNSSKGVILLHQLNRDRKDYNDFAKELNSYNYNVLSIDFRWHCNSDLDWQDFNSQDFNNMIKDLEAAVNFLDDNKVNKIAIVGASVGANIASKSNLKTQVLLSPGLDYRGVKAALSDNKILIIVSEEDKYSFDSSKELNKKMPNSKLQVYKNKGHGISMLDKETKDLIVSFLDKNLK